MTEREMAIVQTSADAEIDEISRLSGLAPRELWEKFNLIRERYLRRYHGDARHAHTAMLADASQALNISLARASNLYSELSLLFS